MNIIRNEEKVNFELRSIYAQAGYSRYKMNKFEEYDLYVRNKDFLISDSVITFTDTNGKLMALKPDVTLSIVKNSRDTGDCVQKVYYDENVYRVSRGTNSFKEITQAGLECIGSVDDYCILEVLTLAAKSLRCISEESVLVISNLDVLFELLMDVKENDRRRIIGSISEKNLHELANACQSAGLEPEKTALLEKVTSCSGKTEDVLAALKDCFKESGAFCRLRRIMTAFQGTEFADMLRIDFSTVNDMNYYNGFVFKGYVKDVPEGVLSGGQYDRLMQKMGRKSGAIGFAVYLDLLERLNENIRDYDVDLVVTYDDNADLKALCTMAEKLNACGKSVMIQRSKPEQIRCRQLAQFREGEVEILEEYA